MAKRTVAKVSDETDEEQENALMVCELLSVANSVAKKLFAVEKAMPDLIFNVYDRLVLDAETEEEASEDLIKAQTICKEMFATETPTPEMVFGVFDRVFDYDDDDE